MLFQLDCLFNIPHPSYLFIYLFYEQVIMKLYINQKKKIVLPIRHLHLVMNRTGFNLRMDTTTL
jgi:hypothetical protein